MDFGIEGKRALVLGSSAGMGRGVAEAMRKNTPMRRDGTVEEMAATAAFLASRQAGYITGSVIRVDGGKAQSNL
ncbi:MAG: SDR family oxidoreductase [Rhodospirillales bacterium]